MTTKKGWWWQDKLVMAKRTWSDAENIVDQQLIREPKRLSPNKNQDTIGSRENLYPIIGTSRGQWGWVRQGELDPHVCSSLWRGTCGHGDALTSWRLFMHEGTSCYWHLHWDEIAQESITYTKAMQESMNQGPWEMHPVTWGRRLVSNKARLL